MKRLIRLTMVLLAIGMVLASAGYYLSRDAPPPQDDDLRLERLEIPDDENAFHHFKLAVQKLHWPEDRVSSHRMVAIFEGALWDGGFVARMLDKNREASQLFDKGVLCLRCQVAQSEIAEEGWSWLEEAQMLVKLLSQRAVLFLKQGKERQAFDEGMNFLALKGYKSEAGELLQSLSELVPEYIDAVPRDPFDGKPMRYSAEKKIVYSIGEDLKDSGGSVAEGGGLYPDEPTYRIEF